MNIFWSIIGAFFAIYFLLLIIPKSDREIQGVKLASSFLIDRFLFLLVIGFLGFQLYFAFQRDIWEGIIGVVIGFIFIQFGKENDFSVFKMVRSIIKSG